MYTVCTYNKNSLLLIDSQFERYSHTHTHRERHYSQCLTDDVYRQMGSACLYSDLQQIARYVFNGPLSLVQHFYKFVLLACIDLYVFVSPNKAPLSHERPDSPEVSRDSCGFQANVTFLHLFFLIYFLYHFFFLHSFLNLYISLLFITNSFSLSKLTATSTCKFIHPFIVLSSFNPSFHLL